jgi:hypothetical protein
MSAARTADSPALIIDTWAKAAGMALSVLGVTISLLTGFYNLVIAPLSARVEQVESLAWQAERDRSEILERLARIEGKVDTLRRRP